MKNNNAKFLAEQLDVSRKQFVLLENQLNALNEQFATMQSALDVLQSVAEQMFPEEFKKEREENGSEQSD